MNANSNVIGVDVGGTKILAGVVGREGNVARHREFATPKESEAALLDGLEAAVRDLLDENVVAVGFGVPSRIDQRAGVAIGSVNIPLVGVPLRDEMNKRLELPVAIENDANAAAIAEWKAGAARGASDVVMITLGTGVGGGLILDGKLFSGAHGSAGEIGHTILDPDGPLDTCGQHGCVEVFCGGRSLAKQTGKPASQLFESAAAGDPDSMRAVLEAARYMGHALINLTNLFDPEVIVMGGGITQSWEQVRPVLEEVLRGSPFIGAARRPRVAHAQLGDDAGLTGALAWARSHLPAVDEEKALA